MKKILTSSLTITSVLTFAITAAFLVTLVAYGQSSGWNEPEFAAPAGNVDAPINVGDQVQAKEGPLILNSSSPGAAIGLSVPSGGTLFGVLEPTIDPFVSPNNGLTDGNIEVNDVYVRSLGGWLSQTSGNFTEHECTTPKNQKTECDTGQSGGFCMLSHVNTGGCDSGMSCDVSLDGGTWKITAHGFGDCNLPAACNAVCIN